jgi:hypothetical protein
VIVASGLLGEEIQGSSLPSIILFGILTVTSAVESLSIVAPFDNKA